MRQHVIVTGAGGGIGAAIAGALARSGSVVGCVDLDADTAAATAAAVSADDGAAYAAVADVTSAADLASLVERAERDHGPITGLVANAGGIRGANVPFLEIDDRAWESAVAVNLGGVFQCVRAIAPTMLARGSGSIVVITSNAAFVAIPGLAHYSAAKGGATSLVRSLAAELAPGGVRVNAVAPGAIRTPANAVRLDDPAQLELLNRRIPMGRPGEPGEVAGAVGFLLGPDASYVTGTTINVDGGFTCL